MKAPKGQKVPRIDAHAVQARLGAAVKAHRQRLGVTQEELAWRADMHRTYIADIERGVRNITLRSMINLAAALQISAAALLAGPGDLSAAAAPPAEILLVEPNRGDAEQAVRVLLEANLSNSVTVIPDGVEALEYLSGRGRSQDRPSASPPQLILLDLGLPKSSGLELLRRLRADEATKTIPVVVLASSRDERLIPEAERLGAAHHLLKPLELGNFIRAIPKLGLNWAVVPRGAASDRSD